MSINSMPSSHRRNGHDKSVFKQGGTNRNHCTQLGGWIAKWVASSGRVRKSKSIPGGAKVLGAD